MPENQEARDAQAVAENDIQIDRLHVADVYAEALLGAGENAGTTEALLGEFDSLVRDILDAFPKLEEILASALISHDEKIGILDRTLGPVASPLLLNFLKVVSSHGRLDSIRAIHRRVHELYDELRRRVRVRVTTAVPVSSTLAQSIAQGLRSVLEFEPVLEQSVDPDLIGGVVVRVGDTVYDASIARQLENMRQQMIDRSAHEIQSRRDRFSYPAGN